MKTFFILIIILIWLPLGLAQGNLGQSGANFLQIGVEPRGTALGGAITALTEGAAALYWNPAGAIQTENLDLYLANTNWLVNTKLVYGGVVKNLGSIGAIGLSVTSFYMDEMEITTEYASEGTGEFFGAGDLAIGLSYARSLTDRFTFGITTEYIHEYIWNQTASQVAFDVGSMYRTDFLNLRIGMVIRNFSGKMKFDGKDVDSQIQKELDRNQTNNPRVERLTPEFRVPQTFQMGIAFDPVTFSSNRLTLLMDVDVPSDNHERLVFGTEYNFRNRVYLRGAYRVNYDSGSLAFGVGLNFNALMTNARFDYSYNTQGVLGNVHRFGVGFSLDNGRQGHNVEGK